MRLLRHLCVVYLISLSVAPDAGGLACCCSANSFMRICRTFVLVSIVYAVSPALPGCQLRDSGCSLTPCAAAGGHRCKGYLHNAEIWYQGECAESAWLAGEPSFGNIGPLIVGLALFGMVFAGSQYTGTAINPARCAAAHKSC